MGRSTYCGFLVPALLLLHSSLVLSTSRLHFLSLSLSVSLFLKVKMPEFLNKETMEMEAKHILLGCLDDFCKFLDLNRTRFFTTKSKIGDRGESSNQDQEENAQEEEELEEEDEDAEEEEEENEDAEDEEEDEEEGEGEEGEEQEEDEDEEEQEEGDVDVDSSGEDEY